ncbi:MAG TPA: hypothetical protein VGK54_03105 [Chloroflexota bacterium]
MQFGLLSLDERPDRPIGDAWEEDLREVVEADRLGFSEALVTEHFGPYRWGPTSSRMLPLVDLFIAKAAGLTKQIR